MSAIINIAEQAAYNACDIIQTQSRNFNSRIELNKKANFDLNKNIKIQSEAIIIETVKKAFPNHNTLSAEHGFRDLGSTTTWIIDAINHSTNYLHTYPHYCVSIGVKLNDKLTHGLIVDPNRNDLFRAESGKGAFLNNRRIRVSAITSLEQSLIASNFFSQDLSLIEQYLTISKAMLLQAQALRQTGSTALDLAYVAAGIIDGFWQTKINWGDIAAGVLLVKEAGGLVIDFNGAQDYFNTQNIIAANPKILNQMLELIQIQVKA